MKVTVSETTSIGACAINVVVSDGISSDIVEVSVALGGGTEETGLLSKILPRIGSPE